MKPHTQGAPKVKIATLGEVTEIIEGESLPYLLMGSIAADVYGGEHWPEKGSDIDFFMTETGARAAQTLLTAHGFEAVYPDDEDWLVKAIRPNEILVDFIFCAAGFMTPDDEMFSRAVRARFNGFQVSVIPAEDYVFMQACTHSRETLTHWFNALNVIREQTDLDWDYFCMRAQQRPDRAIALLYYARSLGMSVPSSAIERLHRARVRI